MFTVVNHVAGPSLAVVADLTSLENRSWSCGQDEYCPHGWCRVWSRNVSCECVIQQYILSTWLM